MKIPAITLQNRREREVAALICGHDRVSLHRIDASLRIHLWVQADATRRGIYHAWVKGGLHRHELALAGVPMIPHRSGDYELDLAAEIRGNGRLRPCDEAIANELGATSSSPLHVRAAAEARYGTEIDARKPWEGLGVVRRVPGTGLPRQLAIYLDAWEEFYEGGKWYANVPSEAEAEAALVAIRSEAPLDEAARQEALLAIREERTAFRQQRDEQEGLERDALAEGIARRAELEARKG